MIRGASELRAKFPSTLDAVEWFCADFRHFRANYCDELDAFGSELLLREALTNAVVHGGAGATKYVSCIIRARRGRCVIAVRDEGAGFDWRAAWDQKAALTDTGGRGIEIFRAYANQVRFNPRGNAVILIKRFGQGTK